MGTNSPGWNRPGCETYVNLAQKSNMVKLHTPVLIFTSSWHGKWIINYALSRWIRTWILNTGITWTLWIFCITTICYMALQWCSLRMMRTDQGPSCGVSWSDSTKEGTGILHWALHVKQNIPLQAYCFSLIFQSVKIHSLRHVPNYCPCLV
jgi:hypothetical protein